MEALGQLIEETVPDGTKLVRFVPVKAFLVSDAMEELCFRFNSYREKGNIDELLLIFAFILDFLCIHPFRDGNGRISRLLTLLLLYQASFEAGRFISLERIEESKKTYYEALYRSSQGWHEEEHDPFPWIDYSGSLSTPLMLDSLLVKVLFLYFTEPKSDTLIIAVPSSYVLINIL